jgi:hypothetical protein
MTSPPTNTRRAPPSPSPWPCGRSAWRATSGRNYRRYGRGRRCYIITPRPALFYMQVPGGCCQQSTTAETKRLIAPVPFSKALAEAQTTAVLLLQTVENNEPPESSGGFLRFFKRKTHPEGMLAGTDEGHTAMLHICQDVPIMGILRMHENGARGMTVRPLYRPVSWRSQSWRWETATCSWTGRRPRPQTARSVARTSIRGSATRGW